MPSPQPDEVRAALDATCDALMTLEALRSRGVDLAWDPERHLPEAIGLLRQAIAELLLARGGEESIVRYGFVLGDTPAPRPRGGGSPHASPRRTA